jgi:hypothetical protein
MTTFTMWAIIFLAGIAKVVPFQVTGIKGSG